jgi:ketosteroid isomerase-like protein
MNICLRTLLILPLVACATRVPPMPPLPDHAVLLEADRAFAADAAERRLEGWMAWFSEDAVKLSVQGEEIRGHDGIRADVAPLWDDPAMTIHWEPDIGGWIQPGTSGYTRGRYSLIQADGTGEQVIASGTYLTLWKQTPDGWRVTFDMGIPNS